MKRANIDIRDLDPMRHRTRIASLGMDHGLFQPGRNPLECPRSPSSFSCWLVIVIPAEERVNLSKSTGIWGRILRQRPSGRSSG